jgi:hypothetical protein
MESYFKINPPADLGRKIISRLQLEEMKYLKRRLILCWFLFIFSALALFWVWRMLTTTWSKSAIGIFLNLFLTDITIVFKYWQNFILAILESLPVIEMAIFLGFLWVFLTSLRVFIKTLKDYKHSKIYLFKMKYS